MPPGPEPPTGFVPYGGAPPSSSCSSPSQPRGRAIRVSPASTRNNHARSAFTSRSFDIRRNVFAGHFYQEASVDKTITGLLAVASSFAIPAAHAAKSGPAEFRSRDAGQLVRGFIAANSQRRRAVEGFGGRPIEFGAGGTERRRGDDRTGATHHQSGWEEAPASPSSSSSSPPPPSPSSQLTWARGRQRCEPAPVLARGKGIRDRLPNAWFARE